VHHDRGSYGIGSKPAAFEALLDAVAFTIIDPASEQDLYSR